MKNEKVGLTGMNWFLSIIGIIILLSFIVLPPVFRVYLKEEVVEEPIPTVYPKVTTTCSKDNITSDNYSDDVILIFTSVNDKIKTLTKSTTRNYNEPLTYQEEKQEYGKYVTAFSIVAGYEYNVTPNDDTFSVLIREVYDLKKFQPTMVVVPGESEATEISLPYQFNDSLNSIVEELTNSSYTCQ